ncbi:MAG TPA: helix-turn-helix domain-containing protein [Candidatus Tectomicrobia bacterium]|nr:helix-turn-helix domain-containing protein [Candidatus Tectomicrobia bacterium]
MPRSSKTSRRPAASRATTATPSYEVRRAFQVGGVAALVEQRRGPRGPHPNRVSDAVKAKILAYALEHPTHGAQRVANELRLQNVNVGVSGVRGVWSRHDLETRLKRLLRLERHVQDTAFVVSEEQLRLLERHSLEFRCRHVEAARPGELLNQDTFFWGTLKGVGKVYVQVVVTSSAPWPSPRSTPRSCR